MMPTSLKKRSRQTTLMRLAREVQQLETTDGRPNQAVSISTGCQAMDGCLPAGGYIPGSIIEYLRATSGCGTSYLALMAAAAALNQAEGKYLVIVDTHHQFYPPALLSHQIDLQRVIWVRPQSSTDVVWATDQALRTTAVAAVIADMERLDQCDARRLQLAAQRGGSLGLLLRGLSARHTPSWAEVQWLVRSLPPRSSHPLGQFSPAIQSPAIQSPVTQSPVTLGPMNATAAPATYPVLRRLELVLARLRGGRAGARMLLDVDSRHGQLHLVQPHFHAYRSAPVGGQLAGKQLAGRALPGKRTVTAVASQKVRAS